MPTEPFFHIAPPLRLPAPRHETSTRGTGPRKRIRHAQLVERRGERRDDIETGLRRDGRDGESKRASERDNLEYRPKVSCGI